MAYYKALLNIFVFLMYKVYGDCLCAAVGEICKEKTTVIFGKVRVSGITIEGDIRKMKAEIGQFVDVTASPVGGNGFQSGTEQFSHSSVDADGNDVSSQVTMTQDSGNPLNAKFQHDGGAECVTTVVFRADGDRDVDEESEIVGTLVIVFDEKNVTAVELSGTAGDPATGGDTGGDTGTTEG